MLIDVPHFRFLRKDLLSLGFLAILAGLFLSPALLTSKVLLPADLLNRSLPWAAQAPLSEPNNAIQSDILEQVYPYYRFLRSEVMQGRFPLWNPYSQNGTPFLATSVSAALSPLVWLLIWLPEELYFEWSAFLKLFLAGSGLYFFCRRLGLPRLCSLTAAVIYQLGGYTVFYLGFPNTAVSCLLGWGLFFLESWHQSGNRRWLAAFSLTLGAAYLGGHMECALLHHLGYGLYTLIRDWRKLIPVFAATTLGFLTASAAVLPFVDFMLQSETFEQRTVEVRNPYYLGIEEWPSMVLPFHRGGADSVSAGLKRFSFQGLAYIGIVPFFLTLIAAGALFRSPPGRAMAGLGVWSLSVLWGLPGLFDLFTALPVLRQGNHIHVAQVLLATVAVIAAMGLRRLALGQAPRPTISWALALSMAFLAWSWAEPLRRFFDSDRLSEFVFALWTSPFPIHPIWALAVLLTATLPLLRPPKAVTVTRIFLVTVTINGLLAGISFNSTVDPQRSLGIVPETIERLRESPNSRVAALGIGTLPPNLAMAYGIRDFRGYESLRTSRYGAFASKVAEVGDPHFFIATLDPQKLKLLKKAGCGYLLSHQKVALPGLATVIDGFPFLQSIEGGSRLSIPSRIEQASDPDEVLQRIVESPVDTVVLELSEASNPTASQGRASFVEDSPDRIVVNVELDGPGWIVLRDTWHPGWTAEVDGQDVPIARADFLFRAVSLRGGRHQVVFEYKPRSIRLGVGLSLLALCGLLAYLALQLRPSADRNANRDS